MARQLREEYPGAIYPSSPKASEDKPFYLPDGGGCAFARNLRFVIRHSMARHESRNYNAIIP